MCEVKTINISKDEVDAGRWPSTVRNVNDRLEDGFFHKLDSDIAQARGQLESYDPDGDAQHIVYINVCFDDFFGLYKNDFLQQIEEHLLEQPLGIRVVVSPDVSKGETQVVGQRGDGTR